MLYKWIRITFYVSFILFLAACNQVGAPTLPEETVPQPTPTQSIVITQTGPNITLPTQEPGTDDTQMTQPAPTFPASGKEFLIEKAKEDLAQRLPISLSQIDFVEATEVVWPDASLGCPQPGMAYAEVLTPGYLILLNADNKEYQYHTSRSTEVIYCENPTPPIPGTPGDI